MRRLLVALVATFMVLSAKLAAEADDIVYFPDPFFKKVLVNIEYYMGERIDLNYDGEIQYSEAEAYIHSLDISFAGDSITDLTGIKAFINIGEIWLERCPGLTTVDLSGMVNLRKVNLKNNPNLFSLNVADCINLKELQCQENKLNYLNLENCKNLNAIWPNKNALTELNIYDCPQIQYLFSGNNQLANIDVSQSKELRKLQIQGNVLLFLDVSSMAKLDQLWVSDNKLNKLNLRNSNNAILTSFKSKNNPDLKCITVDDATYSEQNWKEIDEWTKFSEDCSTGVNDNQQNTFKVFPNPANNSVTIQREGIEQADLRILDITGRIFISYTIPYGETQIRLDVSRLSSGSYVVEINNETKSLIIK
jgi:hypothetical protein